MHSATLAEAHAALAEDGPVTWQRMRALFQSRGIDIDTDARFTESARLSSKAPDEVREHG